MSSYYRGGRGNRGRDAKFPRLRPDNFNRSDLPAELPPLPAGFANSSNPLLATYGAVQKERQRLAEEEQRAKERIAEQEKSVHSIKQVTLDDDYDDPDIETMGTAPPSKYDKPPTPPPPPRVEEKKKKYKKEKKHRKRRHTSDEESDDGEECTSSRKSRKKKHRRDRRDQSEDEAEEVAAQQQLQRLQVREKVISPFDVSRNAWVLLRKNEYRYNASHMVIDCRADRSNRMDINDIAHFIVAKNVSPGEAKINNIDGHYSVLQNHVTMNKNDVKAWLEFIDIQRPYHDKNASGNPNARSEKAYYDKVMEVIRHAIHYNKFSAELELKKMQIMEEYHGIDDEEVRRAWKSCEDRFVNNTKLWEGMLKMRINNRNTFKLGAILKDINRAIERLVDVKMGVVRRFSPMEGTDKFLIELLVTRFRLLIAAGCIERAIGMLQALAEFHFFRPAHLDQNKNDQKESPQAHLERARSEFAVFWNCGAKRIGEEAAEGWCLLEEEGFTELETWKENEEGELGRNKMFFQADENKEMEICRSKGKSKVEMRKALDTFRTQCFWMPLHFIYEGDELHEHRYVDSSEILPLLFPMENVELLREMIYKMLHLLGVPIPGLKFNSQEDILGAFSTIFTSTRPNTMKLHMFEKFINDFVGLLASSEKMDTKRIYTGILTCISNSSEKISTKIEKLKNECGEIEKPTSCIHRAISLDEKTQLAFLICALDEIARLQAEPNTPKNVKDDPFVLEMSLTNLVEKNTPFWTIGMGQPERLFHLRFLAHIVRKLPFSDAENAHEITLSLKGRKTKVQVRTKRGFLLSFWATGKVGRVEETQENIDAAWTRVTEQLKNAAPRDDQANLQYRWLGHEYELLFELAALFCYEFPRDQIVKYQYFERDIPLFTSELAKSLNSAAVQEIRIRVLQHMMHISKGNLYTPGNLGRMLERQMESHQHSIFLLRTYLDVTYGLKQRNFLYRNPGKDPLARLIRDCGRLYTERKQLSTSLKELAKVDGEEEETGEHEENQDEQRELPLNKKEKKRILTYWMRVVRKIAEDHSNNLVPDDYIWCNLMCKMVIEKHEVAFTAIDEVFDAGQKVCPWSKQFLFETAFTQTKKLNDCMNKHKLHIMCSDGEEDYFMKRILK